MSKTGIQRFLSHDSGAMTDVYAHMLDQTLKQEWLATKERVNAAGERVPLTTPLIDDDAAWLKHQQRVGDAERAGHERLVEINRPDVIDLRRIIAGLDRLGG
jgi:hypothetical protein